MPSDIFTVVSLLTADNSLNLFQESIIEEQEKRKTENKYLLLFLTYYLFKNSAIPIVD